MSSQILNEFESLGGSANSCPTRYLDACDGLFWSDRIPDDMWSRPVPAAAVGGRVLPGRVVVVQGRTSRLCLASDGEGQVDGSRRQRLAQLLVQLVQELLLVVVVAQQRDRELQGREPGEERRRLQQFRRHDEARVEQPERPQTSGVPSTHNGISDPGIVIRRGRRGSRTSRTDEHDQDSFGGQHHQTHVEPFLLRELRRGRWPSRHPTDKGGGGSLGRLCPQRRPRLDLGEFADLAGDPDDANDTPMTKNRRDRQPDERPRKVVRDLERLLRIEDDDHDEQQDRQGPRQHPGDRSDLTDPRGSRPSRHRHDAVARHDVDEHQEREIATPVTRPDRHCPPAAIGTSAGTITNIATSTGPTSTGRANVGRPRRPVGHRPHSDHRGERNDAHDRRSPRREIVTRCIRDDLDQRHQRQ